MATRIGKLITQSLQNSRVSKEEVDLLIVDAKSSGSISKGERKELTTFLNTYTDKFDADARMALREVLGIGSAPKTYQVVVHAKNGEDWPHQPAERRDFSYSLKTDGNSVTISGMSTHGPVSQTVQLDADGRFSLDLSKHPQRLKFNGSITPDGRASLSIFDGNYLSAGGGGFDYAWMGNGQAN